MRTREEVYHEVTSKFTMLSACYVISLRPPLYLRNALPVNIQVSVAGCTVSQTDGTASEEAADNRVEQRPNLNSTLTKADFLDYGEKVVNPGDVLHLPTFKTTTKEGERCSLLVVRVRIFAGHEIPMNAFQWRISFFGSSSNISRRIGRAQPKYRPIRPSLLCGRSPHMTRRRKCPLSWASSEQFRLFVFSRIIEPIYCFASDSITPTAVCS